MHYRNIYTNHECPSAHKTCVSGAIYRLCPFGKGGQRKDGQCYGIESSIEYSDAQNVNNQSSGGLEGRNERIAHSETTYLLL